MMRAILSSDRMIKWGWHYSFFHHVKLMCLPYSLSMNTRIIIVAIVIVILALGAYIVLAPRSAASAIASIDIAQPNLEVHGTNLDKVEIWAIPEGVSVASSSYQLLGDAALESTASNDGVQLWKLEIPAASVPAAKIFARGYDPAMKPVGDVYLPQTGSSLITAALWPDAATTTISASSTGTAITTSLVSTTSARH